MPRLQQYIISTRNALVTADLGRTYRSQTPDSNLRVFCASNTLYWEHRDDRADRALPFLRLSGILDIRRHCTALVSESQLRMATSYMRDSIPELLSNVELWVRSGAGSANAEQKQMVREALDTIERQLRRVCACGCSVAESSDGLI